MNRYLLDSGPLSAYLRGRQSTVTLVSPWLVDRAVATTLLSYGEVAEYLKGLPNADVRLGELRRFLREVRPLPLSYAFLDRYSDLRRRLRPPYGPGLIGDIDTLMAATAIEHRLTLVTLDRDLRRVPDLDLMLLDRRQ